MASYFDGSSIPSVFAASTVPLPSPLPKAEGTGCQNCSHVKAAGGKPGQSPGAGVSAGRFLPALVAWLLS